MEIRVDEPDQDGDVWLESDSWDQGFYIPAEERLDVAGKIAGGVAFSDYHTSIMRQMMERVRDGKVMGRYERDIAKAFVEVIRDGRQSTDI
jgi:hypothetical protein